MHHHGPKNLKMDSMCKDVHEPPNLHDTNALTLFKNEKKVGYTLRNATTVARIFKERLAYGKMYAKIKSESEVWRRHLGLQQTIVLDFKCRDEDAE